MTERSNNHEAERRHAAENSRQPLHADHVYWVEAHMAGQEYGERWALRNVADFLKRVADHMDDTAPESDDPDEEHYAAAVVRDLAIGIRNGEYRKHDTWPEATKT